MWKETHNYLPRQCSGTLTYQEARVLLKSRCLEQSQLPHSTTNSCTQGGASKEEGWHQPGCTKIPGVPGTGSGLTAR